MSQWSSSNLVQRIASAVVLVPLLVVTIWLGGWWVTAAASLSAAVGLHELYQLFAHTGYRPRTIGYVCAILFILAAAMRPRVGIDLFGLILLLTIVATLVTELLRPQREGALVAWSLTLSGSIYIGWTLAHFVLLRDVQTPLVSAPLGFLPLDSGTAWILTALLITFSSDTGAYAVGRVVGRHRMAPAISPGKTWEGAIAGLLSAIVIGLLLVYLVGLPVPVWAGALIGALGSLAGQAGDLAESLLKRQVGVKDSGHLIPGHGGLLDRADSLLFTVPLLYYVVRWLTL